MKFSPTEFARLDIEQVFVKWRECQPKLLVVTDGLNFNAASGFGLTQFVTTLKGSTIHGMTPQVITAFHNPNGALSYNAATQHITNFRFEDATHGLLKSRYDVVFLLGINSTNQNKVTPPGINAIAKFMEAGGGVFATGDHQDLGMALCGEIPRVRAMRKWTAATTPNAANSTRLSTNHSGDNGSEEFEDQSDSTPQRLYLNFTTIAGGIGNAHPLMQRPGNPADGRSVEVYPDHPHEGECVIPTNLATTFPVDGVIVAEWPGNVVPEVVAMSMSHGDGFPGKSPLMPRSFITMAAYNGQLVNKGRVVTDATWHHYVNINLDGTGQPGFRALILPGGSDSPALQKIRQVYRNLATWLMPANVRRCRWPVVIFEETVRFPLFEELRLATLDEATVDGLREVGAQVRSALSKRLTLAETAEMTEEALSQVIGSEGAAKLAELEKRIGRPIAEDAGLVALGALTTGLLSSLLEAGDIEKLDPHKWLNKTILKASQAAVLKQVEQSRVELKSMDAVLAQVGGTETSAD